MRGEFSSMTNKKDYQLDITPQTIVGDLLKNYPQLEDKLIEIAPVFKKLKNPVLRRTVAKVTSLKQAAAVGNVSLSKLINELRKEVGLDNTSVNEQTEEAAKIKPFWVTEYKVMKEYDAREDLENGIQPAAKVTKDILQLNENEKYVLITPFIPAPLIEIMENKNFVTFTEKVEEEIYKTYVRK